MNARLRRGAGAGVCAATLYFWGTVIATQAVRADRHPLSARLSEYLSGPGGGWLHAAYYVLAAAILVFAAALQGALRPYRRTWLLSALLALTACAIAATAASRPLVPVPSGQPAGAAGMLHILSAITAFVAASAALMVAALRLRHLLAPAWARFGLGLALFENAFLLSFIAVPGPWPGARQKCIVFLVTLALFLAGLRLMHPAPLAAARAGRRPPDG